MNSPITVDPTRCPLCGGPNACGAEAARASGSVARDCWCVTTRIAPALLAQLPPEAVGKACICRNCAEAAAQSLAG